jgi:DNA-binding NarL/FixJ family response regulator
MQPRKPTKLKQPVANKARSKLTKRELEVLEGMAQGFGNKQIGKNMGVTEQTVKNHVTNIFEKFDTRGRTKAVIIGLQRGLLDLSKL